MARITSQLTLFCLTFLICQLLSLAQEPEPPKLKDFGSSLERLKWDSKKKTTVERTGKPKSNTDDDEVVRIETDLVLTDFAVLDQQKRLVVDLTKEDFILSEDDVPQAVSHFSLRSDQNLERTIVLIIDYSSSMAPYINLSMNAAKRLLDQLGPRDRMAIVTDDVILLADFTSDKKALRKELDGLAATAKNRFGRSMQISALMATVRELFSEEDIRPIIIFQTDVDQIRALQPPHDKMPQARHLPYNFDYVLSETEKSGATVYSIFPGVRYLGIPREEQLKRSEVDIRTSNPNYVEPLVGFSKDVRQWLDKRLKQQQSSADIANLTGGFTRFLERPEQAETIYSDIFNDLNNRYVVGYYPTNKTRDGKRRQIKISIKNHPEYTIWGRNSYRAPVE